MAETRSAAAAAAGQANQLEAILTALHELQTKQSDSAAQLSAQLQRQQDRLDALERDASSVPNDEAGAANLCMNPTCAQIHGNRREKCVEDGRTHDFCGLMCASATRQVNTRPAGPQPFPGEGAPAAPAPTPGDFQYAIGEDMREDASAAPAPTSGDFQYAIGEDMRDALARKPGQLSQNTSLLRLQMQLHDINYNIQERIPPATRQAHPAIFASLLDLQGKFNTHIDAYVVAPCVMRVSEDVAAAAFNQGAGSNLFSTAQGTELFQSWARRSLENAQKQATDPSRARGGAAQRGGRQRGTRGGQNQRPAAQQQPQPQSRQPQQQQRGRSRSARASPPRGADGGPAQP
jgi:hypothetical protein